MKLRQLEHEDLSGEYPEPWLLPHSMRWVYRALTGRPMDNRVYTNATFFRRATKGYPSRWLRLPGWQRALTRVTVPYALLLTFTLGIMLSVGADRLFLQILIVHLIMSMPALLLLDLQFRREHGTRVLLLRREVKEEGEQDRKALRFRMVQLSEGRREWMRDVVVPLAVALAPLVGSERRPAEAAEWVTVPRSYLQPGGKPVEIRLPAGFHGADPKTLARVERSAAAKLGMLEVSAQWQLSGSAPRLLLSAPDAPPARVTFAEILPYLESSQEYRPVLGMVSPERSLQAEMIEDSPHIALGAGPGAGKSTAAKLIIMQALRWGWGVVVLDWKMTNAFAWLARLQGVTYLTDIQKIHDLGVRIGQEIDIRKSNGLAGRAKVLIVRDEWNITADLLMAYWQDYRASLEPVERTVTPVKSPALRGYATLDYAGREFGLHDLVIAQRLSARAFNGNADIRECFQIKGMARYSEQTKKMMVGNMKPFPKKSNLPGRWTIVAGEQATVVQVPWIENEEAREYASGGVSNPLSPFSSSYGLEPSSEPRTLEDRLRPDAAGRSTTSPILDGSEVPTIEARKLAEMVEALEPLGITYNILRNAARSDDKGDPLFPPTYGGNQFSGYTYDFDLVKEWARRRRASKVAERQING